ncbi:glycosyl hydrolase-related protein [Treponema sp. OttesenSCG-928-L16]|nr:glycosyl hydrolase-related protein [Treponema sp. OttesenSCG-928-L16]
MKEESPTWPVFNGDLNPEFTGTYSLRTALRVTCRNIENSLIALEAFLALARIKPDKKITEKIDEIWWEIFFIQSHDPYTGSMPTKAYIGIMEILKQCGKTLNSIYYECLGAQSNKGNQNSFLLWTGHSSPLIPYVYLTVPNDEQIASIKIDDHEIPFFQEKNEVKVFYPLEAQALKEITILPGRKETEKPAAIDKFELSNGLISIKGDNSNGLGEIRLIKDNTAAITKISLVVQEDRGNFQVEAPLGSEIESDINIKTAEIIENDLIKKAIISGEFPVLPWDDKNPPLVWSMECTLSKDSPFAELKVSFSWHGEKTRIRLKIDSIIDSAYHVDEIPFGTVKRGSYRDRGNSRGEWPVHRFSCIEDSRRGFALVNKGVSGVEYSGSQLRTTMVRAPFTEYAGMIPDDTSSQHGDHTFSFILIPYTGSWKENNVAEIAQAANNSIMIAPGKKEIQADAVKFTAGTSILSSIVRCGDSNDILVRVYETAGCRDKVSLAIEGKSKFWESDIYGLKSNPLASKGNLVEFDIKPFEIKTILIAD